MTWTAYRLDAERMNEAELLIGEHDFASFTRIAHGRESTVHTIYQCKVDVHPRSRRRCDIEVVGNGFLYNMVRIIAGTLIEVGACDRAGIDAGHPRGEGSRRRRPAAAQRPEPDVDQVP